MPESITNEQRKKLASKRIPMEVSPFEMAFVLKMRQINFGRVTAVLMDGVPFRIETNRSDMVLNDNRDMNTIISKLIEQERLQNEQT